MPLYRVKMVQPDGDEYRTIELEASDEDEAKFLCEQQARSLVEAGEEPYVFPKKGAVEEIG